MKHLPYAPYIMHVIEQVSGIRFPYDTQQKLLKISNKTSIIAARELRDKADAARIKGKVFQVLTLDVVLQQLLLLLALLVLSSSLHPPLERSPTSLSS